MRLYIVAALLHMAMASPANAPNTPTCAYINRLATAVKAQSAAATFCSQYLKLPAQSTFVYTAGTRSVTCQTPAPTAASAVKVQAAVKKPDCFKGYVKPAQISSACSCISQPTATPASSFKVVAGGSVPSGIFPNGNYAKKGNTSPPNVLFDTTRSNALVWSITSRNENAPNGIIRGRLTAQDSAGGSAYLTECGNGSGGPFCNGNEVLVGTASEDKSNNGGGEEYLICDIAVRDDRTCSLDCDTFTPADYQYVGSDGTWYAGGATLSQPSFPFTPLIGPV